MPQFLLDPLGFRLDGTPFWGFSGGDGEGGDGNDPDDDDDDEGVTETDPVTQLKTTLQKVTDERRAVRDEYRPWKAALRELGIESPEALRTALGKTGDKPKDVDVEKIREDARREAQLEANREVALTKVEALAGKSIKDGRSAFADPDDAVEHLRSRVDDLLDRNGKPDVRAIEQELTDLLMAKPHYGTGRQDSVDFDGGARQPAGKPQGMDEFIRGRSRAKQGR